MSWRVLPQSALEDTALDFDTQSAQRRRPAVPKAIVAGHPSVKKRQKELLRKERQAEKLSRRDERRLKRGATTTEGDEPSAQDATAFDVAVQLESPVSVPAVKQSE